MEPTLEIKVALKISKPLHEIFEAIVDPAKMSHYFIAKGSGRMEEGKKIIWQFPEMDIDFHVRVGKVEKDKYVSFRWDDYVDGIETLIEMTLETKGDNSTFVTINEKERKNDEQGIRWLKSNTEGWANFLACMKAYLEHGIDLRKNAFDISQMPEKKLTF